MKPLVAQSPEFWQTTFQFTSQDAEELQHQILEQGHPLGIDDIGLARVKSVVERERATMWAELTQGKTYRPDLDYDIGDRLIFSHFDFAMGTVINKRDGYHPDEDQFTVIDVEFDTPSRRQAKFVTNLQRPHALSADDGQSLDVATNEAEARAIYQQNYYTIRSQIDHRLRQHPAFVEFNHHWFIIDLMVPVEDGLLNIVDAAIDINGAPLNVDNLIEQMELQDGEQISDATRFSVNYCLQNDERFENVGSEEVVLWYLLRLKPAEVLQMPFRLHDVQFAFNSSILNDDQKSFLATIEDDATPVDFVNSSDPQADTGRIALNYAYWQAGIIPVVPTIEYLLPEASRSLIYLQLIDGRSGDVVSAWYTPDFNYMAGLKPWLDKYNLPVGAFIILTKTDDPMKFVIDYQPRRLQQEWVRSVKVEQDRLVFGMAKVQLACEYDELMIIIDEDINGLDRLAYKVQQEQISNHTLLRQIFPELMKLTSQGAVHIKTLYSALNLVKRCPPGPLLETLVTEAAFEEIGHGYWTYI